jgi:hypothetical protein
VANQHTPLECDRLEKANNTNRLTCADKPQWTKCYTCLLAQRNELLEALRQAASWNKNDIAGFDDITPTFEMLKERAKVIRATIAKAEGRGC